MTVIEPEEDGVYKYDLRESKTHLLSIKPTCESALSINIDGLKTLERLDIVSQYDRIKITEDFNTTNCTNIDEITIYGTDLDTLDLSNMNSLKQVHIWDTTIKNIKWPKRW